jgi:hypothetical protein
MGNGDGTFGAPKSFALGTDLGTGTLVSGDFNGDGRADLTVANESSNNLSMRLGRGDGTFADPGQLATTSQAKPVVADVNGDGAGDVLVVDGAGNILYRQGQPGRSGSFDSPVTVNPSSPSRDIAWVANRDQAPFLASVDARDDAVSLYAFNGHFVRFRSLLAALGRPARADHRGRPEPRRLHRPGHPQRR